MLQCMMQAPVGDDVFGEDPTANELQAFAAAMFGREAALFVPSGTMANQIAILLARRGIAQVLCARGSHIHRYEAGGYAFNGGSSIGTIPASDGKLSASAIKQAIEKDYDWLAQTTMVVVENTSNHSGGNYYRLEEVQAIAALCREADLHLHLDGARLFNALVETGEAAQAWGTCVDTLTISLSKGLGAPVGSLLVGDETTMKQARKYRKVLGGGMRQVGMLAAAGLYGLRNNIKRLADDHRRARTLADALAELPYVTGVRPVMTNVVLFDVQEGMATSIVQQLAERQIRGFAMSPSSIRFVTHLDIDDAMLTHCIDTMRSI